MNAATLFDTHEFVKNLTASGFDTRQAEALSCELRKAQEVHFDQFVTKADLRAELAPIRSTLEHHMATKDDIHRIDNQLLVIKWMLALVIVVNVLPALKAFL